MEPTTELVDSIYRERILRARRTPLEHKFAAGARLFERSCRLMAAGIRSERPDADEEQVQAILRQRLTLLRLLREQR